MRAVFGDFASEGPFIAPKGGKGPKGGRAGLPGGGDGVGDFTVGQELQCFTGVIGDR